MALPTGESLKYIEKELETFSYRATHVVDTCEIKVMIFPMIDLPGPFIRDEN